MRQKKRSHSSAVAFPPLPPMPSVWRAVRFGLGMAALQLAFTSVVTGGNWADLAQWDANLFIKLVNGGYHSTLPPVADLQLSNVGFFPGFMVWSALFHHGLRIDTASAVILASQVAAIGFW